MGKYSNLLNPKNSGSQAQPIAGREKDQKVNSAGGYVFVLDKWSRLDRFSILGSDSQTYYQSARTLTKQNAEVVNECWAEDPVRTAQTLALISKEGRAPKQSPVIFALALGAIHPDVKARQNAMAAVSTVCRTASDLFEWMDNCRQLKKGYGRGMKRTIARWYSERNTEQVSYQAIKYRQRNSFTHKRALEVSHKGAGSDQERQALYRWMRGKYEGDPLKLPKFVQAHVSAMTVAQEFPRDLYALITDYKLPWEAIPTWALTDPEVWNRMIPHMGLTALIRKLGTMTACQAITPYNYSHVLERLLDANAIQKSRVHPFNVLQALSTYRSGHGFRGSKTWIPVTPIIDALDAAFYASFKNVEATGKRILLALDVSGSMTSPLGGSALTCREASAAMALVTLAVEPNVSVVGFTSFPGRHSFGGRTALTPLNLSARQRLDDAVKAVSGLSFGGTDCALPFIHAIDNHLDIDAFVVYTDNETWAGSEHPVKALQRYRRIQGINAKSVVVGMTSTGFSIADPQDAGMLDVVGFDSAAPALISNFISGWDKGAVEETD